LFKDRQAPEEVREVVVPAGTVHMPALLVDELGVASRSEARRMVQQGGVSADGEVVGEIDVDAAALDGRVVRAGKKRFARIRVGG
jgi:tyrosyl-tRNA synthetase